MLARSAPVPHASVHGQAPSLGQSTAVFIEGDKQIPPLLADAGGDIAAGLFVLFIVFMILGAIKAAIEKLTAPKTTEFDLHGKIRERRGW